MIMVVRQDPPSGPARDEPGPLSRIRALLLELSAPQPRSIDEVAQDLMRLALDLLEGPPDELRALIQAMDAQVPPAGPPVRTADTFDRLAVTGLGRCLRSQLVTVELVGWIFTRPAPFRRLLVALRARDWSQEVPPEVAQQ